MSRMARSPAAGAPRAFAPVASGTVPASSTAVPPAVPPVVPSDAGGAFSATRASDAGALRAFAPAAAGTVAASSAAVSSASASAAVPSAPREHGAGRDAGRREAGRRDASLRRASPGRTAQAVLDRNARWLNPRLVLLLVLAGSTGIWLFYEPLFAFKKYYSLGAALNYAAFYLIIFAACFVTEKTRLAPSLAASRESPLDRFLREHGDGSALKREAIALAAVAGAAQLLWIARIVQYAGLAPVFRLVFVEGNLLRFKEQIVNFTGISGVTTLTQLALIASGLYSIYVFGLRRKGSLLVWAFILFPGVLRGMLFSERVALLEVVAPIVVIAILFGRVRVTAAKLALAIASIALFFSAAEGFRSYQVYAKYGAAQAQEGMYGYGVSRLLDYVGSSVNHSMAMADLSGRTFGFPTLLFNGWINFLYVIVPEPVVRSFLHMQQAGLAYQAVKASPYSAPDYTNMGFFGEIFADVGYLYFIYAIAFGWFVGMAYKGVRRFETGWLLLYPTAIFALLESYRIHYLFDNRVFYPLLYVALRYAFVSFRRSRAGIAAGERSDPRDQRTLRRRGWENG